MTSGRQSALYPALLAFAWAAPAQAQPERWLDAVVQVESGASLCAGVLVDAAGTVATAYHCVASGRAPRVRTRDGLEARAEVVGTDPRQDLAVLAAPGLSGRPWLALRAAPPTLGEPVWALGHPFGADGGRPLFAGVLSWSVSAGVVSAVGERLVQVDAPMNPGSSGGPVVDAQGRVVGLCSRKLRGEGVGFITPAWALRALLEAPRRRPGGGELALGPQVVLSLAPGAAPALGGFGELSLRDTLVLRAEVGVPVNARATALALGSSGWVSGGAALSGRLRVGRGPWSAALDLGGGLLVESGYAGRVGEDAVFVVPQPAVLRPAASARLSTAGVGLRVQVAPAPAGALVVLALDLERPGTVGVW